jgi:hypothetical protein
VPGDADGGPVPDTVDPDRAADGSTADAKLRQLCATIGRAEFGKLIPRIESLRSSSIHVTGFTTAGCSATERYDAADPVDRSLQVDVNAYSDVPGLPGPAARCRTELSEVRQGGSSAVLGQLEDAPRLGAGAGLWVKAEDLGGTGVRVVACRGAYYLSVRYSVSPLNRHTPPQPPQRVKADSITFADVVFGKLGA